MAMQRLDTDPDRHQRNIRNSFRETTDDAQMLNLLMPAKSLWHRPGVFRQRRTPWLALRPSLTSPVMQRSDTDPDRHQRNKRHSSPRSQMIDRPQSVGRLFRNDREVVGTVVNQFVQATTHKTKHSINHSINQLQPNNRSVCLSSFRPRAA